MNNQKKVDLVDNENFMYLLLFIGCLHRFFINKFNFLILFFIQGSFNANKLLKKNEEADYPVDWAKFHDNIYSVWLVMLNVDFDFDSLTTLDRHMAQVSEIVFSIHEVMKE